MNQLVTVAAEAPHMKTTDLVNEAGKDPVKHESPISESSAFFPPLAASQLTDSSPIVIAQGKKQAITSDQAGVACIGLSDVWGWQKEEGTNRKATSDLRLIDDLAPVNWHRDVVICFDTDSRRNHEANYARAELARILCDQGAEVLFLDLPCGERGDDGEPGKMAIDDYIFSNGEEAFRELVNETISPSSNPETLKELRIRLDSSRTSSIGNPGVYVDLSPTGSGKSTAEKAAITKAGSSLTVLPTHDLCKEIEEIYLSSDLDAAAYPKLSKDTCQNYEIATKALGYGLAASQAVCPRCKFKEGCEYQYQHEIAKSASHRICTHSRAALSFATVAQGRPYIAIHEKPIDVLRPLITCNTGFEDIARLACLAENDIPGRWPTLPEARLFFHQVASVAEQCAELLKTATETTEISFPGYIGPPDAGVRLFEAIQENPEFSPEGDAMRICLAVAAGSASVTVKVRRQKEKLVRHAVAVWLTQLPADATCWISDATGDVDELRAILGASQPILTVIDSSGSLPRIKPLQQVPIDVSKSTSPERVGDVLSQAIAKLPNAKRIGVITHRKFLQPTSADFIGKHVSQSVWSRIVKTENFYGTESRGANSWKSECDALIVVGTPRKPPHVIENYLIQTGNLEALRVEDPVWLAKSDAWSAKMPDGSRQTIKSNGYRNRDWHNAYTRETHSELLQAVGRARSNCDDGIPAIVVSNENLGLDIAGFIIVPLSTAERTLLAELKKLTDTSLYYNNSETSDAGYSEMSVSVVTSKTLSSLLGKTERQVRRTLAKLESRGLVERVGQRSGWRLTSDAIT